MQNTNSFIGAAEAIQELGVTGLLALSNLVWFWIARMLWRERNEKESQLHNYLKSSSNDSGSN